MITKQVLHHKIVRVVQSKIKTSGGIRTCVDYLELDNGVLLIPCAMETETEPIGDLTLNTVRLKTREAKSVGRVQRGLKTPPVKPNPSPSPSPVSVVTKRF